MRIEMPDLDSLADYLENEVKPQIEDEFILSHDEEPGIDVTLACSEDGYCVQLGDNSYIGSAYFHDIWGVSRVYRDSDSRSLAEYLMDQVKEQTF